MLRLLVVHESLGVVHLHAPTPTCPSDWRDGRAHPVVVRDLARWLAKWRLVSECPVCFPTRTLI